MQENSGWRMILSLFSGVFVAVSYGVFSTLAFKLFSEELATMTLSFLFVIPFVIGALTVYLAPVERRQSKSWAFFTPWLSYFLGALVVFLFSWEAALCVMIASPIAIPLAGLGGLLFHKRSPDNTHNTAILFLALTPYLLSPRTVARWYGSIAPQQSTPRFHSSQLL